MILRTGEVQDGPLICTLVLNVTDYMTNRLMGREHRGWTRAMNNEHASELAKGRCTRQAAVPLLSASIDVYG